MTHICVGNLTIIGPDNGLSPGRRQAIIWTSAGILLIGPWGTNFSEVLIGIHTFSFKKIHLKMSSAIWRSFCLGLNVLIKEPKWNNTIGNQLKTLLARLFYDPNMHVTTLSGFWNGEIRLTAKIPSWPQMQNEPEISLILFFTNWHFDTFGWGNFQMKSFQGHIYTHIFCFTVWTQLSSVNCHYLNQYGSSIIANYWK